MLCEGDGEGMHTQEKKRKAKKQIADWMRTNLQERRGAFHLLEGIFGRKEEAMPKKVDTWLCENELKNFVSLPAEGKQNANFSPILAQPGAHLLEHPCSCLRLSGNKKCGVS